MVDLDAGMGGSASTKGGGTPEIQLTWYQSKAERQGGGQEAVFNNGVDPQLQIMEILGEMTAATIFENLRYPSASDGREI